MGPKSKSAPTLRILHTRPGERPAVTTSVPPYPGPTTAKSGEYRELGSPHDPHRRPRGEGNEERKVEMGVHTGWAPGALRSLTGWVTDSKGEDCGRWEGARAGPGPPAAASCPQRGPGAPPAGSRSCAAPCGSALGYILPRRAEGRWRGWGMDTADRGRPSKAPTAEAHGETWQAPIGIETSGCRGRQPGAGSAQMAPRHNHHVDLRRHQVEDPRGRRGAPRPRLGLVVGARRRGAHQQVQAAAELNSARGRPHASIPRHGMSWRRLPGR